MNKEITLLTVDWDAFIPEPIEADMQHAESLLYRDVIWNFGTRDWLPKFTNPLPCHETFWDRVTAPANGRKVRVSDSHVEAFNLVTDQAPHNPVRNIILVDAHHDLWPCDPDIKTGVFTTDCGNWLSSLCHLRWIYGLRRIDWYVPKHSHCWEIPGDNEGDRFEIEHVTAARDSGVIIDIHPLSEFYETYTEHSPLKPDYTHVCRSSCWTPPWCDERFREWVEGAYGAKGAKVMGEWDPFDVRSFSGPSDRRIQPLTLKPELDWEENRAAIEKSRAEHNEALNRYETERDKRISKWIEQITE